MSMPEYRDFDPCATLQRPRAKAAHCQRRGLIRRGRPYRADRDQRGKSLEIDLLYLLSRAVAIARTGRIDLHLLGPQHDAGVSFIGDIVDSDASQDAIRHPAGQLSRQQRFA
jgi:hypothetical protein